MRFIIAAVLVLSCDLCWAEDIPDGNIKPRLVRDEQVLTAKQAAEQHQQLRVLEDKTAMLVDVQKISLCRPREICLKHRDHCFTLLEDSRGEIFGE